MSLEEISQQHQWQKNRISLSAENWQNHNIVRYENLGSSFKTVKKLNQTTKCCTHMHVLSYDALVHGCRYDNLNWFPVDVDALA